MKQQKKKFKVNKFYELAEEYRQTITDEEDLIKKDLTETFYKELKYMVKHGEIIKININAKMRLGKSTVGFSIGKTIFEYLKEHNLKPKTANFGINNIARDQQEYSRMMKNDKRSYDIIVVDEDNETEKTGENSSTMKAISDDQSSIQAGRYIHDIKISPKGLNDDNADLIIDIISQDKETMTNYCLLSYRYQQGLTEHTQLLGNIKVYVGNVIENWVNNVLPKHQKELREEATNKEKQYVKEQKEKDWYVDYYLRKHEKMDLMNKHGITRARMLEYAPIYLKIIEALKPLTKMSGIINERLVRAYVKQNFRKAKLDLSIVGEVNSTKDVLSILDLYVAKAKITKEIEKIEKKGFREKNKLVKEATKIKDPQIREYLIKGKDTDFMYDEDNINNLKEIMNGLEIAIRSQIEELEELIKINKEYNLREENGNETKK